MRLLLLIILLLPSTGLAGPPFATDDPEPVEYRHAEFYIASLLEHNPDSWSGTAPHAEINYGALPGLQLHLIAPLSFFSPSTGAAHYGYGDTELGFKYRFIDETASRPQLGTFPLLELPTGSSASGLGTGETQFFLPLWVQKAFGDWLTYGGGGYWRLGTRPAQDWWFFGWLLQYRAMERLALGAEVFCRTAHEDADTDARFNFGAIYDFNELHHLLFSVGRGFQGGNLFQSYLAWQLTVGPRS